MLLKTLDERFAELDMSLRLVVRCCKHFHETKDDCYLLGVLSQLRALVSFKPWETKEKGKTLRPLLLDLAEKENIALRLYSYPPKPEKGPPNLAGHILSMQTWSVFPADGFQEYALRDWIQARAYHVHSTNTYRSRNDVIRQLTEKGAVHYDEEVGEIVADLKGIFSSKFNGMQFFVLETAKAIGYLGVRLLIVRQLRQEGVLNPERHDRVLSHDKEFAAVRLTLY